MTMHRYIHQYTGQFLYRAALEPSAGDAIAHHWYDGAAFAGTQSGGKRVRPLYELCHNHYGYQQFTADCDYANALVNNGTFELTGIPLWVPLTGVPVYTVRHSESHRVLYTISLARGQAYIRWEHFDQPWSNTFYSLPLKPFLP